MAELAEVHAERTVDRHAAAPDVEDVARQLVTALHAEAAALGARLARDAVWLSVQYEPGLDRFTTKTATVHAYATVEPIPAPCKHATHRAPDPVDRPTACPCGMVTRHPAPAASRG